MRKRWLLAAGTMAGLVGVVLFVLAMLPPGPGVTKANFDRVEKGMTRAQVVAILGKATYEPPGWGGGPYWTSNSGDEIRVRFDENQRVESMIWDDGWPSETLIEKILDRLLWWKKESPEAA